MVSVTLKSRFTSHMEERYAYFLESLSRNDCVFLTRCIRHSLHFRRQNSLET